MSTTDDHTTDESAAESTAEAEHRFHHYSGNRIPWYVHLVWVSFWIFAVYYALAYLLPEARLELPSPP